MALRRFDHLSASTLEQARSILARHGSKAALNAGGTDLLGVLKDGVHGEAPEIVVDLKRVPGLDGIRDRGGSLGVGALVTLEELASAGPVVERFPILASAARSVGSPQIRNMGTVGGNLCQEPRCWYYRSPGDAFHCLRKGGSRCAAIAGDNRYHSIFGAARISAAPCSAGCPGRVDIPSYMSRIRDGETAAAAAIVMERNPFPAITGRVCPHRCEGECNRGEMDEAVSIREVERVVGDWILDHGHEVARPRAKRSGRSVAVVGAGPAGLAAAFYLRRAGHDVVVLDRMREAGGMLAWSIPSYRLPVDVIRRQVRMLERMGIRFQLGVEVGVAPRLASLRREHDAVFLATGAWKQRSLGIEHEDLLGSGLEFLVHVKLGDRKAPGRKVLVIGGGNVAIDVAITALRLGAKEVVLACLEGRGEMPAFPDDVAHAEREGVRILDSWGPGAIIEKGGRVRGMDLVRCTSVFDEQGRFRPRLDTSVTRTVRADRILLAIGQSPDLAYAGASLRRVRGRIDVDRERMSTSMRGVYAGGDTVTGPASIIEAIAAGRRAARSIDASMRGRESTSIPATDASCDDLFGVNVAALSRKERSPRPVLAGRAGGSLDAEDAPGFDVRAFEHEAGRCLNCGCVAVSCSDLAPALVALDARVRTTGRTIAAADFFAARPSSTTALGKGEIVTGVQIPAQPRGARQCYMKFRIRNSIDFPIVSVAAVLDVRHGRVRSARIVLGAVAPVPVRAREAEDWLEGKRLDAASMERVADLAVSGARPLQLNGFKTRILRTLVRRSLESVASP